ncbi:MAG: DsbE family thiol:disulfide interchange protein [Burkholderiales bacterium]|nr:DsbE family thiol:disulfide interchange protein [Burkholderiales bacterium]
MNRLLIPAAVFAVIAVFLGVGLTLNPREVPSPLIGKPVPAFSLPTMDTPVRTLTARDLAGRAWVLNVFASWCAPCREEHPLIVDLVRRTPVPVYGLNYKDRAEDARNWLARFGNPYQAVLVDADGRAGIDFGVYGVPETFVIDRAGVVRYKKVGPLTREIIDAKILPLLKELDG